MSSSISPAFISALEKTKEWFVCGIERESLRARPNGDIADSPHPSSLGAKLTHPHITTDFSESQLELITSPHSSSSAALQELGRLHNWIWSNLGDDLLWPNSMPCRLPLKDSDIAIAEYGKSNQAELKHIYRKGLAHRYGRAMQTISGVHFNLSLGSNLFTAFAKTGNAENNQKYRNDKYFALMRNYRRYSFVVNYLLGASPAIDKSMARLSPTIDLQKFINIDSNSLVGKNATTLRQSDIGYVSAPQRNMNMCFNDINNYVQGVNERITTPYQPFSEIGITSPTGEYLQLGDGLLQIENEYYTVVRPKRNAKKGERPLIALANDGVEYLEIRNLDINPFTPYGIDLPALDFMTLMLLWCAAIDSPVFSSNECKGLAENDLISATCGRDENARVFLYKEQIPIQHGVQKLASNLLDFARILDNNGPYQFENALQTVIQNGPLSNKVERACNNDSQQGYIDFNLAQANKWREQSRPPEEKYQTSYSEMTSKSFDELAEIENIHKANPVPFNHFFANYMCSL